VSDSSRTFAPAFRRVILPMAVLTATMVGLGFLIIGPLAGSWPLTSEDHLVRALVAARTPRWNRLSNGISLLAYTPAIICVTVLAGAAMRMVFKRWRESLFLAAAVCAQVVVFLVCTLVIVRDRPAVRPLDTFPPAQSFPSGHTSAAVALYGGIALVLGMHARRKAVAVLGWITLLAFAATVGISRVYRGMHHPSDIIASFINGLACLWIMRRAILETVERGAMAS
jgi:membrane-associated phospholipid phosphatase